MSTTRRAGDGLHDLNEEELRQIQIYNSLSEEGKFLYQIVEIQKKTYEKINIMFWYLAAGVIFAVLCVLYQAVEAHNQRIESFKRVSINERPPVVASAIHRR